MKYPLTTTQIAGRELTCLVKGHDWKSSWRRKKNAEDLMELDDKGELPYSYRASVENRGNPYYEYAASWRYKCVRCRRTDDEGWLPFYKHAWYGLKQASSMSKIMWDIYVKEDNKLGPKWKVAVGFLPMTIVASLESFYLHISDRLPYFPLEISSRIHMGIAEWIEKKGEVAERLKAPDSKSGVR